MKKRTPAKKAAGGARTASKTSTKTSTKATTKGNITVTGGAGRGATTTVNIGKSKKK